MFVIQLDLELLSHFQTSQALKIVTINVHQMKIVISQLLHSSEENQNVL